MILITNDDGYASNNLKTLYNVALTIDDEVKVVCPKNNQSNVGGKYNHVSKKFNIKKIKDFIILDGTPTDCIHYGLNNFKPNLILTGINEGYNISADILLSSGTFMSARKGALYNIKSLACSMDKNNSFNLNYHIIKKIILTALKEEFLLGNLNLVTNKIIKTKLCDKLFDFHFQNETYIINQIQSFPKNTDGDVVFNQQKSSLTIIQ